MPAGDSSFHLEIGTSVPRDRLHLSRVSFPACDKIGPVLYSLPQNTAVLYPDAGGSAWPTTAGTI